MDRRTGSSKLNPFSKDGVLGKSLQKCEDKVNKTADKLLHSDGVVMRTAERVPLVNKAVQKMHKRAGDVDAEERAKDRNPLGPGGYITKVAEHVPLVADGIHHLHKSRGRDEEAERARAFSLQRIASKGGPVMKVAELLPGTNLLAALRLELQGESAEALRALDIVGQWKNIDKVDGALAKVAELFPGTDLIAFATFLKGGQYAGALRAICKTRWVYVTSQSTVVIASTDEVRLWRVLDVHSDLEISPKAASLSGALVDLCIGLADYDKYGKSRWRDPLSGEADVFARVGPRARPHAKGMEKANKYLQKVLNLMIQKVPENFGKSIGKMNSRMQSWRSLPARKLRIMMGLMHFAVPPFPYSLPPSAALSAKVATTIQAMLPEVTVLHQPMPLNPGEFSIPPRDDKYRQMEGSLPQIATAVTCCACIGCLGCGLHTGPVACMAGCGAAVSGLHRLAKRNCVTLINMLNAFTHKSMSQPVTPLEDAATPCSDSPHVSGRPGKSSQRKPASIAAASSKMTTIPENQTPTAASCGPMGIVMDWPAALLETFHAAELVREYILNEHLSRKKLANWGYPSFWLLQGFEQQLRTFLDEGVGGQLVPIAIPIRLPKAWNPEIKVHMPEIRLMLILWCCFADTNYVRRVQLASVDGMLEEVINVAKASWLAQDLRELDSRLAGFKDPVHLNFDVALSWSRENRLNIALNNIGVKLSLPE